MTARLALDLYIDVNLVLVMAALLWAAVETAQSIGPARLSHRSRLGLLQAALFCALASPVLSLGLGAALSAVSPGTTLSASELAVSTYVRGGLGISATQFENWLGTRTRWTDTLVAQDTVVARVLAGVLFAGMLWALLRFVLAALLVRRTLACSFLWRRSARVDVRLSDRVAIPFAVRGIRRNHVVVPSDLLCRPADLRIALAHEFQHIRQGDTAVELILEALRPLFFWNPAYLLLKLTFERRQELACDERVLARLGIGAGDYVSSLLGYCGTRGGMARGQLFAVALVRWSPRGRRHAALRVLKQRFRSLRDTRTASRRPVYSGAALALFSAFLAVGVAGFQSAPDWSHDRLMLSTIVNLERLEARNRRPLEATFALPR